MPQAYESVRMEIACLGIDHENIIDIYRSKINVLGGMNFVSVDNINKSNKNRNDNFRNYISDCYPYIDIPKKDPEPKGDNAIESLIEDYKRIFGGSQTTQQDENKQE